MATPRPTPNGNRNLTRPRQRVASGTPVKERERLARQEATHPDCRPLRVQTVIWVLRAANAVVDAVADELQEPGLSPSGFGALMALFDTPSGSLEPHELAERLLISRASVTGVVDTLVGKGLVERHDHASDRRRILVTMTPQGYALLEAHLPTHFANQAALLADLSDDDLDQLVTLLRRVTGATPPHLVEDG